MIRSGGGAPPASFAKVGSKSIVVATSPDIVPVGIRPGQRMMQGTRNPPSQVLALPPRRGWLLRAAPPLSDRKITKRAIVYAKLLDGFQDLTCRPIDLFDNVAIDPVGALATKGFACTERVVRHGVR